jgi:SSS family solute:Na+ symporter
MNPFLGGIVTAGIVAAVFGGVATVSLGMTSLVVRDFVVPLVKPSPEHQLRITRYVAVLVGFLPLPFVLFMPGILKTMFFSKALRTSVALVAVSGFYLPMFSSGLGATIGLIAAALGASVWFFLGNPYGIDNTYVAMVIPVIVMSIDHIVRIRMAGRKKAVPSGISRA